MPSQFQTFMLEIDFCILFETDSTLYTILTTLGKFASKSDAGGGGDTAILLVVMMLW